MIVALFDNTYTYDIPDHNNFIEVREFDIIPPINSVLEIDSMLYKIDHFRPITFQYYDNTEIMCVFLKPVNFDIEYNHNNYEEMFNQHKAHVRKAKIKKVLED